MAVYKTVPRQILSDFISSHTGQSFTVKEIVASIISEHSDIRPSESTVYRLMRELVANGMVIRDVDTESRENVYYFPGNENTGVSMRCRVCGSVYSVDNASCKRIKEEISRYGAASPEDNIEFLIKCKKCK